MSDPFPNGVDCAECLWRDYLAAAPPKTVTQAADAILALINSRPQTPTKEEVVGLLARELPQPDQPGGAIAAHREEWSRLFADWFAKVDLAGDMCPDAPGEKEATAAADAALDVLQDLETDLCELRATSWEDIAMLADILLRNEFDPPRNGLWDESCEAYLDGGPTLEGEWIDHITARLLRAIRDLTVTGQPDQGEGKVLREIAAELRTLTPPLREAFTVANEMLYSAKEYPAAEARLRALQARYGALCERAWALAPASPEGCVLLAEIVQQDARDWADHPYQMPLTGGDHIDGDPARLALGHLAMAVLRMGRRRFAVLADRT